jgi:hypothetical protein
MPLCSRILISGAALMMLSASAEAQTKPRCPEGRTLSGECVNPVLAQVMRKTVVIATQPKISTTAPLYLPSDDRYYALPGDHHEFTYFFSSPPVTPGTVRP